MIVRCLRADYQACAGNPDLLAFLDVAPGRTLKAQSFPVAVGEAYVVIAVALGPHTPWFFVDDRRSGSRVPPLLPSALFDVLDARPSRLWRIGTWVDYLGATHALVAPQFWASDAMFHGKAFEGDARALSQLESAAQEMLLEWPLPWISARAIGLTGTWVTDPEFESSWETDEGNAMTVDPRTGRMFHNPLWRGEPTSVAT